MEDDISLDEFIENFRFESLQYVKREGIDHIHTLMPLESNDYIYALQANEKKFVKHIINTAFYSFRDDGSFDKEYFLSTIDQEYEKSDHTVSQEYLMNDFLVSSVIGTSQDFLRVSGSLEMNKANQFAFFTLKRLVSTFQSISILIKNGFFYETHCLFRVALEQISYAYKCSKSDDDNVEKIQPQRTISELKKTFEVAGHLNGLFSNYIHHNLKIWSDFLELDKELYTVSRSGIRSKQNVLYLAVLVEMYVFVFYDIYERINDGEPDENFHNLVSITIELIDKIKLHFAENESSD